MQEVDEIKYISSPDIVKFNGYDYNGSGRLGTREARNWQGLPRDRGQWKAVVEAAVGLLTL